MSKIKLYFVVFLEAIKKYKFMYIFYLLLVIFISLSEVFIALSVNEVLNIIQKNESIINLKIILYVCLLFISFSLNFINNYVYNKLDQKIEFSIWKAINKKLSLISWYDLENTSTHSKIEHISNNSNQSYRNICLGIPYYLANILKAIFYIYLSIKIGIVYVFILLILIIGGLLIKFKKSGKIEELYIELFVNKKYTKYLIKFPLFQTQNIEFKTKNLDNYFENKCDEFFNKQEKIESKILLKENIFKFILGIYWSIVFFVVLFLIINKINNDKLLQVFTMSVLSYYFLFNTIENISKNINEDFTNLIDVSMYNDFVDFKINENQKNFTENIEKIFLKNIMFKYPNSNKEALRNLNVTIERKNKIMIVGDNGSGKTTLCTILSGINKEYEGDMFFNNSFIAKEFNFKNKISYMSQEFGQYYLTIKENILFGKKIEKDIFSEIFKKINIEYDENTIIGNLEGNGINLSKGQWQRIAIGRLIAKENIDVYILDEPTSYLDPIAELNFYKEIDSFVQDKIVFYVSHRLGYATHVDKIIFMENGQIIDFGSHDYLYKNNKKYKKMFDEQRKWYV